jgi:hypothetical protein
LPIQNNARAGQKQGMEGNPMPSKMILVRKMKEQRTLAALHRKVDAARLEIRELHFRNERESAETRKTIAKVEGLRDTAARIQKALDREGNGKGEVNAETRKLVEKLK